VPAARETQSLIGQASSEMMPSFSISRQSRLNGRLQQCRGSKQHWFCGSSARIRLVEGHIPSKNVFRVVTGVCATRNTTKKLTVMANGA
jgi:hypothetical protein